MKFQWYFKKVSRVFQGRLKGFSGRTGHLKEVLREVSNVHKALMFQVSFHGISKKFQEGLSKKFEGCYVLHLMFREGFKGVKTMFKGGFKEITRGFHENFKGV